MARNPSNSHAKTPTPRCSLAKTYEIVSTITVKEALLTMEVLQGGILTEGAAWGIVPALESNLKMAGDDFIDAQVSYVNGQERPPPVPPPMPPPMPPAPAPPPPGAPDASPAAGLAAGLFAAAFAVAALVATAL
mmetsp:Transcript_62740/g.198680  ORF Transcript_62740/g.198680 Transcript_62740/m.198680 type:complete len:134 (+) Transcript_62740:581-982(+)